MRSLLLALVCAAVLFGADSRTEKPDPIEKAREMLANAHDAVSAAQPDVQVAALYHLCDNYQDVNRKKALETCKEAFAAAQQLPDVHVHRASMQTNLVRLTAKIDVSEAIEMVKLMPKPSGARSYDPRTFAIHGIAVEMVKAKQPQALLGLIEEMGSAGAYSFPAAYVLLRSIPASDPLKLRAFSSALAAYRLKPDASFTGVVRDNWRELPPQQAAEAISSVLSTILSEKYEENLHSISFATAKGMVTFESQREADLFDIMHIVREIQPKRAVELLEQYPAVRTALEQYPRGKQDMESDGQMWTFTTGGRDGSKSDSQFNNQWRMKALAQSQAMTALSAIKENPDKALAVAATIADPAKQVEVLTSIIRAVAETNAPQGKLVLKKAADTLADIKSPVDRSPVLDAFIEAAAAMKDEQLADEMLKRALAEAAELQKAEAKAQLPNPIMRENWPSTQAYRRIIMRATKMRGVDAEPLLLQITDADLNLLLRIEMAQALLGRPQDRLNVYQPRLSRN